jgi:hypothetical protein
MLIDYLLSLPPPSSAQAELKTLLVNKTKVIKETEQRKSSLEQLEKQLDEFIAVSSLALQSVRPQLTHTHSLQSAKAIQDKFSKM